MPPSTSLPKYVQEIRVKGHTYLYFRYKGKRTKLPSDPSSPEFFKKYAELLEATRKPSAKNIPEGTVAALIRDYKASPEFMRLARDTQDSYRRNLDRLSPIAQFPIASIKRAHLLKLRDKLADRPRAADLFAQVARRLFSFAEDRQLIDKNPLQKYEKINDEESHEAWLDEDYAKFEASNPPLPMLTAYLLGRYTGQRRGDVLKMQRSDYDGKFIRVCPNKTRKRSKLKEFWIPAHKKLKAHLDNLNIEIGPLVFSERGRRYSLSHFSREFAAAVANAGLVNRSFHGLRHGAGVALAEAGCTDEEIQAILGHRSKAMVQLYTQHARQKMLALSAMAKVEQSDEPDENED